MTDKPVVPKNLFYLVQFRLQEAQRKRDEYAVKNKPLDREMWQLWRGKAKAFKVVLDLMERKA